jgi:glucose-6-phosphate 1-dehydrogenase
MAEAMGAKVRDHPEAWEQFSAGMFYEPVDLQKPEDVVKLGGRLEEIDRQRATRSNRTFYLSVSPKFYAGGCRALADAGLLKDPQRSRVVIEKPFGRDYGSAQSLNKVVQACGQENQIFRIDHYLGKETVQTRFSNPSGIGITSPAFRSLPLKPSESRNGPVTTKPRALCATWCKTT